MTRQREEERNGKKDDPGHSLIMFHCFFPLFFFSQLYCANENAKIHVKHSAQRDAQGHGRRVALGALQSQPLQRTALQPIHNSPLSGNENIVDKRFGEHVLAQTPKHTPVKLLVTTPGNHTSSMATSRATPHATPMGSRSKSSKPRGTPNSKKTWAASPGPAYSLKRL